jgi:hypothetical protein
MYPIIADGDQINDSNKEISKILAIETECPNWHKITKSNIKRAIKQYREESQGVDKMCEKITYSFDFEILEKGKQFQKDWEDYRNKFPYRADIKIPLNEWVKILDTKDDQIINKFVKMNKINRDILTAILKNPNPSDHEKIRIVNEVLKKHNADNSILSQIEDKLKEMNLDKLI